MQALWKSVWEFLTKLKIELPYDPGISLLAIYQKDSLSYHKGTGTSERIATIFTIARKWDQPRCPPAGEWVMEMYYRESYSVKKKSEIMNCVGKIG